MKHPAKLSMLCLLVLLVVMLTTLSGGNGNLSPGGLNILLTNDDGYQSPLIHAVREALIAAGHNVTIVAPLENQSGVGATLKEAEWVEVIEQAPGIWSVDNTPAGAVIVALDLIMADNPPDLIISGMNFGQNLGLRASTGSGTVSAAHMGLQRGFPAIACSLGILIEEQGATPYPFPSTLASITPAAGFMARLVGQLPSIWRDGRLLPPGIMLAVNFPVPYDMIKGIRCTRLGKLTLVDIAAADPNHVISNGGGLVQAFPVFYGPPDPVPDSDTNALWDNYISITVMDGDMSLNDSIPPGTNKLKRRLADIRIH
jgi:5'/3'-nucleotidase SurE